MSEPIYGEAVIARWWEILLARAFGFAVYQRDRGIELEGRFWRGRIYIYKIREVQ